MTAQAQTQIQIRIDSRTKNEAKKVLENLGMDISTAVKMLFKQIIRTGTFPLEIRDVNGFSPRKAQELREAIADVEEGNKKKFSSVDALMKDLKKARKEHVQKKTKDFSVLMKKYV